MTGYLLAALGLLAGLGLTSLRSMASEEIRDRLDHLPHAILRLAARRLPPSQRVTVYQHEWLPELEWILKRAEARPITRLITGIRYAIGLLISATRIARHLHRESENVSHLEDPDTGDLPPDPAQLLPLALSRPQDALLAARSLLTGQPGASDASLAHHAIGIVLRDHGDLRGAIAELKKGVRLARTSGRPGREVDVQASLGATLALAGRSRQGLAVLNRAVEGAPGDMAGRVLMRRAAILKDLGRFHEAHQDLSRALPYFRRAGDTVWEARSLIHRADIFLALGLPERAGADFARAGELFAANGQELEYAKAQHSLGLLALARGDLPETLA